MADPSSLSGRPVVVGANHRSSPLALRDSLFVDDAAVPQVLARLKGAGIEQALVLSTCDRVEVHTVAPEGGQVLYRIAGVMAAHACIDGDDLVDDLYVHTDDAAVRHLFSVASSLDSQVIGEPQVLGQVKACHRLAREAGMIGPDLESMLQAAYTAAKRVRTETAIGEHPVSIAAVAVQLARDLHGDLDDRTCLLMGNGDMGLVVAEGFAAGGVKTITVTHPVIRRAEVVARTLECHVSPYEMLADTLAEADVVIAAVNGRSRALGVDILRAALKRRRYRPIFIVDTGVPGDVEPAVERIDEAFVYTIDDLESIALEGKATREVEAVSAQAIVDGEVACFLRGRAERAAVPVLVQYRDYVEGLRTQALLDARGDAEKATRLLVNRLLHRPSQALRDIAAASRLGEQSEDWQTTEKTLARLFGLDQENDDR